MNFERGQRRPVNRAAFLACVQAIVASGECPDSAILPVEAVGAAHKLSSGSLASLLRTYRNDAAEAADAFVYAHAVLTKG